ncbi:MAG: GTP-binding protein, partial [archaeon]|nr:GTP-binding protein [archaeon]
MIPIDALSKLHKRQHNIRNICILAHVDHGKTTLADTLIASNGIISEKSAGQVRYMDNREDEQHRLITMKSSAISLAYKEKNPRKVDPEHGPLYLINLIDSPGHVDFTSEVSTAVRVSDGAIIVVDVVDGVGVQTKTVIRQMWKEHLSPILVLNKVDRLITHRKMTAVQAFLHLGKILEQINVILASFLKQDQFQNAQTSDVNPQTSPKPLDQSSLDQSSADQSDPSSLLTTDDWVVNMKDDRMERYFAPERDNVVFASAADRWGFRLSDFSRIYAERFGLKPLMLRKALWGDHYLKATKNEAGEVVHRIVANPSKATSVPLFVELVLRPIWEVYRNAIVKFDAKRLEGIIKTLAVKVLPRDLVPDGDHRNLLRSILSQWLPLSPAVLGTVIDHVPSPIAAQARRVPKLFRPLNPAADISPQLLEHHQALMRAMTACDPSSPDIVVFIAKVFDAGEKPVYHRSLSDAAASNDKEA